MIIMETDKIHVPPIKCQGIKTKLITHIKENISWERKGRWIEPFLGSGVVLFNIMPKRALVSDINPHIIDFYNKLKSRQINSETIRKFLIDEGNNLKLKNGEHYYFIRERFNRTHDPLDFLFLNRSCFNGVMRFNSKGNFNVPYGHKPDRFRQAYITKIINQVKFLESILNNDWEFVTSDWKRVLEKAKPNDFVYLDPPYIGRHADYYNQWSEKDALELVEMVKKLPCRFIFSMWSKNKYRTNPHMDLWKSYKKVAINHFYHVGPTEKLRNKMEEVLIMGSR
jgi:DNA adenine methylase